MNCKLCGREYVELIGINSYKNENSNHITIHKCNGCGIEQITDNHIIYTKEYFKMFSRNEDSDDGTKHNLDTMETIEKKKGSILDIGTGCGNLLKHALDRGWIIHGHDIVDGVFYPEVKKKCFFGDLKKMLIGKVDVISMREVIEHTDNPIDYLMWCKDHLVDGGAVYIQTPDAASTWSGKYAMGHLWSFTYESLVIISGMLGFRNHQLISQKDGCLYMLMRK